MMACVLALRSNFKIFRAVISLVAIAMVNDLAVAQGPFKHLLGDNSVLVTLTQLAIGLTLAGITQS